VDVQAQLATFHTSLSMARTGIQPREVHSLSEANMTSGSDFNDGNGQPQDVQG